MRNILKIITALLIAELSLVSCSTKESNDTGMRFKPVERTSSFTEEERIVAINKKKADINIDTLLFGRGVKISVLQPELQGEDITQEIADAISMKMLQMTSQNGISGIGINPDFVLGTKITQTERSVTSTIPQRMMVGYDITFVVLNVSTGDVYGTSNQSILGVGDGFVQANRNAVGEIKNTPAIQEMLQTASTRIIDWYNQNSEAIKRQINTAITSGELELALALAKSVPSQCTKLYAFANNKIGNLSVQLMRKKSKEFLGEMHSIISISGNEFNPEVGAYFKLIPIDAPEYAEAKKIYNAYEAKCEKRAKAEMEYEKYKLQLQHAKELEEINADRLKAKYEAEASIRAADRQFQNNPPTSLFGSIGYAIGGTFQRIFRGVDKISSSISD